MGRGEAPQLNGIECQVVLRNGFGARPTFMDLKGSLTPSEGASGRVVRSRTWDRFDANHNICEGCKTDLAKAAMHIKRLTRRTAGNSSGKIITQDGGSLAENRLSPRGSCARFQTLCKPQPLISRKVPGDKMIRKFSPGSEWSCCVSFHIWINSLQSPASTRIPRAVILLVSASTNWGLPLTSGHRVIQVLASLEQ